MATKAPEKEINEHGDEVQQPRFGGRQSWADTHEFGLADTDSPKDIADKEEAAGSGAKSAVDSSEKGFVKNFEEKNRGLGAAGAAISASPVGKIGSIFFKNRKRQAATGMATLTIAGGIFVFSILQGPFQFIHFAQLLQKFHLSRNEDFGDGRGAKLMLYAMAGVAERGRLGEGANGLADRWENRMVAKSGLRPLYNSSTGRLAGYEIVSDKTNRFDALNEILDKNPELREAFDRMADEGAELRSRDEALDRGQLRGTASRTGLGAIIDQGNFVLDFRDVNERGFRQTRIFTKAVGSSMVGSKIAGAIGSRLLIKRGGVNFHIFNNLKKVVDKTADANTRKKQDADYQKSVLKRWSESIKVGVSKGNGSNQESRDLAAQAETEGEGLSAQEDRDNRIKLAKAAGPAAIVGLLCGVKELGDGAADAKYANNVLPMMRMGMGVVSMGHQAESGLKINLDEMGVIQKLFYDEKTKTDFPSAKSIQAELDQPQSGPDAPAAAKLSNVGNKGDVFEVVDFIVGLPPSPSPVNIGTGCTLISAIDSLLGPLNSIIQAAIDGGLGLVGTSSDELMADLIAVINGESINPLAKGAEFGNLANIGTFLAANDQALATGGAGLSTAEAMQLREQQDEFDREEQSQKQFFARYFDPYDHASLSGKIIDSAPASSAQVASMINPIKVVSDGFASLFSSFQPKAQAAQKYNYGTKTYGFPIADQESDMFEDPYENAEIVEPQLTALNEKYGKCFGMTVDDTGKLQNDKAVNVFDLEKEPEYADCRDDKNKEIFKRYQFYIADTVTFKSLACFEGDEEACAELGAGGTSGSGGTAAAPAGGTATITQGTLKELAQKILDYKDAGKYSCDNPVDCQDLELMVAGSSIAGGMGCTATALDKRTMQMIIYLIDSGYKIGTFALCRSHTPLSQHSLGLAFDISSINGKNLGSDPSSKSVALEVNKIIFDMKGELAPLQIITANVGSIRSVDPAFVKYNRVAPGNEGASAVAAFGSETMIGAGPGRTGHTDHIHVGY